jgi:hypothetical protein
MNTTPNLSASVAARLLNRAKQSGDDYQTLLTAYCLERFLYRLGAGDRRDRFVLKGAMLLAVVGSAVPRDAGPRSPAPRRR